MGWQIYEKWIDMELFCQMVDLIYRLSTNKEKEQILNEMRIKSLFWKNPIKTMEEEYELHYPGEVLERLGERTKLTKQKIRALGYALAQTRELQEEGMFIGTQFSTFRKVLYKKDWQTDFFLLVIHYLMEEKEKKKDYKRLLEYPWGQVEEFLLVLATLPDDETIWDKVKHGLNQCLGKGREFSVSDNIEAYAWICYYLVPKLKGYRKKDLDTLKSLSKLPCEYARDGSALRKKLLESGYTVLESLFLNYKLIRMVRVRDAILFDSITAERMAIEICSLVLNEENIYPKEFYTLCKESIHEYRDFYIKIEGAAGILGSLKDKISPRNIASYQCLYSVKGLLRNPVNWFQIDLLDERWEGLYEWLSPEEFEHYVSQTLQHKSYDKKEMSRYLGNYEKLTGRNFTTVFWENDDYEYTAIFRRLVALDIINPIELAETCVREHNQHADVGEKWHFMMKHMLRYMEGIQTYEGYQMLVLFMNMPDEFDKKNGFVAKNVLFNSFGIQTWGRGMDRFEKIDLIRVFLTSEEHIQIFLWLEKYIFQSMPEYYVSFLEGILENKNSSLWLPQEEARTICFQVLDRVENRYTRTTLRKCYMSEEEFEKYESQQRERERRRQLREEQKELDNMKRQFTKTVAKSYQEGTFKAVREFLEQHRFRRGEQASTMIAAFLYHYWKKQSSIYLSRKEIRELLKMELLLFENGYLEMEILRNTIKGVEVQVNA